MLAQSHGGWVSFPLTDIHRGIIGFPGAGRTADEDELSDDHWVDGYAVWCDAEGGMDRLW